MVASTANNGKDRLRKGNRSGAALTPETTSAGQPVRLNFTDP